MNINISKKVFNPAFLPVLDDRTHRYIILYGGAGSGKSVFAVQRFVYRLLGSKMCNLLVVRKVADTNRDSTFALFCQIISKWGVGNLFKINNSDLRITCVNGNSIVFKGLDDVEKLKSVTFRKGELTDVWIEEASEITEEDFNQLDVRLRGKGTHKQIVLTFNPIDILHWIKQRFFDRPDGREIILKSTYKDNNFLDDDYRRTLESYKDTDPYYYSVYCLGEWGVTGSTIFDAQRVNERIQADVQPIKRGEFIYSTWYNEMADEVLIDDSTIQWVESPTGSIKIYHDREDGVPYVIGGDTAGEGSDWFVGQVIDNHSGMQVCTLHSPYDEDLYAKQMYCLGIYYNKALISIEANFSSYPIKELERLRYPHQYARQREDSYTHKLVNSYGFKTTSVTRPLVIAGLVEVVRDHSQWISDKDTLQEMLTFVRNEKGRAEAQEGAHDDCVLALAIAYYSRDQQSVGVFNKTEWTESMKQDYNKASPDERAYLRRKWGNPD